MYIVPLRWCHLSSSEQRAVIDGAPDDYEQWEIYWGYYMRDDDGIVSLVEDSREH